MPGLKFPPTISSSGQLELSATEELPLQSIRQIAAVEIGEVVFSPQYGSDSRLFESGNTSGLKTAIDTWLEPQYWAVVTPTSLESMTRTDLVEWLPNLVTFVPLPPS